jgi:glucose-6-phosphate 1-dehydrogenase
VTLASDDPDWQNVPLRLTTGKALRDKQTAITITYTDGTTDVFQEPTDQTSVPDGYERVLMDAMTGNKSIFTTSPEIIRAWEILAPIQTAWAMDTEVPRTYRKGSAPEDLLA